MSDTFDYLTSRDTADRLIGKYGQAVTVRKSTSTGPDYDPTLTTTDYATKGVKIEFTIKQIQSGILATDERWLIAAGPLVALGVTEILPSDHIVIGSVERSVGPLSKPLAPSGTVVLFDIQAQK